MELLIPADNTPTFTAEVSVDRESLIPHIFLEGEELCHTLVTNQNKVVKIACFITKEMEQ